MNFSDKGLREDWIRQRLRDYSGRAALPERNGNLRRAAVLLPLLYLEGAWQLLYIRRAETVFSHKGQVAFPGGMVEPEDPTLEATALREAQEEVGLPPENVRLLGRMPDYPTVSSYLVTPVVGRVEQPFELKLQPEEVVRAFTIPLEWLADASHWEERSLARPNGREERVVYFQLYEGELLWGITARITVRFLQILGLLPF